MKKAFLLWFLILAQLSLSGCVAEKTIIGYLVYINTGQNKLFGYELYNFTVRADDGKLYFASTTNKPPESFKLRDRVEMTIRGNLFSATTGSIEIDENGKKTVYREIGWRELLSIKKLSPKEALE